MQFKDIVFPLDIAKNSFGGPEYIVNIIASANGSEFVQKFADSPKVRYDIESNFMSFEDVEKLISFFRTARGKTCAFKFKDWTDFRAILQKPKEISKNKYQLIKKYEIDNETIERKIELPIFDTVFIVVNGEKLNNNQFIIENNGIITISQEIEINEIFTSFEFYIKARFDNERLNISINSQDLYSVKNISIVEVI